MTFELKGFFAPLSHPAATEILLPTLWPQVRFCFLPLATVSCQCIASPILSSFFENAAVGSEPRRCSDGLLDKMRAFLRVLRTQGQERTTSRQQGPLSSLSQSDSQSSPSLPVTYSLSLDVCVCVHVYLHVYTLSCVHSGKSALPSRRQRPLSLSLSLLRWAHRGTYICICICIYIYMRGGSDEAADYVDGCLLSALGMQSYWLDKRGNGNSTSRSATGTPNKSRDPQQ